MRSRHWRILIRGKCKSVRLLLATWRRTCPRPSFSWRSQWKTSKRRSRAYEKRSHRRRKKETSTSLLVRNNTHSMRRILRWPRNACRRKLTSLRISWRSVSNSYKTPSMRSIWHLSSNLPIWRSFTTLKRCASSRDWLMCVTKAISDWQRRRSTTRIRFFSSRRKLKRSRITWARKFSSWPILYTRPSRRKTVRLRSWPSNWRLWISSCMRKQRRLRKRKSNTRLRWTNFRMLMAQKEESWSKRMKRVPRKLPTSRGRR